MTSSAVENRASRALVVMAHPAKSSVTRSVAEAIIDALEARGIRAELADLIAEGFNPIFSTADQNAFDVRAPTPDDVRAEQQRIDEADHLVLVYPVYWWSMPALLKGWIDRVFISGWAFDAETEQGLEKRLGRLKVHLVALGGADAATYAKRGYREAMRNQIDQGVFGYCGAIVETSILFTVDQESLASLPLAAARAIMKNLS